MQQRFKALCDFKSREFNDTQYAIGMTYTVREGNEKLESMLKKWLNARLFKALDDVEMLGMKFSKGDVSYCLDDAFADVVESWVLAGKAEYIDGQLVTINFEEAPGGVVGG